MTVFDESQKPADQTGTEDQAPSTETMTTAPLEEMVGESKEELAALRKKSEHADQFIETLKAEMAELREDLAKRVNAEQALQQIKEQTTQQPAEVTPSGLGAEDVEKILTEREARMTETANVTAANEAIVKHFGGDAEKAGQVVQAKAAELGLSVQDLRNTAAKSPTAFLSLVGAASSKQETIAPAPKGTVTTTEFDAGTIQPNSWEYFQKMRKEDPVKYNSQEQAKLRFQLMQEGKLKLPTN